LLKLEVDAGTGQVLQVKQKGDRKGERKDEGKDERRPSKAPPG
jgi:hypothetical protein